MPLEFPRLDDRRYDDILAEIRTRIPRYTPEWQPQWNDLNDSDPGMILAQTYAWLAEMLLYRMGRVPELNYLKFLDLIGVDLLPAEPARAEVTLAVAKGTTAAGVAVPPRVQLSAEADEGPPVIFETERALTALTAELRAVQSYDGAVYADASAENTDASGFAPFGTAPREGGALCLGLGFPDGYPTPDSFVPVPIDLAVFAAGASGAARTDRTCGAGDGVVPARLVWEGFDGVGWVRLDALSDETLGLTRSGHLVLRVPAGAGLARAYLGTYDATDPVAKSPRPPLFWLRARLERSQYTRAPRLAAIRTNTVPVLQAQTVRGEILGGTSGARHQSWRLANRPVIGGSLRVEIDQSPGLAPEAWEIRDDLFASGPTDQHLALARGTGELRAGDGERGQVPVANPANPDANVVAVEYRHGGGKRGNVGAGRISTLLTSVAGLDSVKVANLFAAAGGTDEERIEEAKVRARRMLKARDRAVSVEDFEMLARQAGNVRRAKALPRHHPRFPGTEVPGAVTLIIVPDTEDERPSPTDALLRTVCAYLEPRRLLTTELHVTGPAYVTLEIEATVATLDDADPIAVRQGVEAALDAYLDPLTGGDAGTGWPFGGTLRYSKLVQQVFRVAGVDSVPAFTLTLDGEAQPECRDAAIPSLALVDLARVDLTLATLRELEGAL